MKTSEYWKTAALLREVAVQEGATATAKDILKLYDEALDDINTEIQKIKYNFQRRFGLDDKTANMFLTEAQREENLASLIYALENAPDEKARQAILKYIQRDGLSVRAYASRIERYDAVKQSIYARVKRLAVDETALVSGMLKKAYSVSYYSVMDDTAKGLDVGINFGILNDRAISEAVSAKWNGKQFSERIWDNTEKLAEEAQKLVTKSIMSGESWNKTADKLANRFQVEKYHATTLVHTEAAHAHAMADMQAYEDLGIEEYKYLATLDYATCETCQPLDGKVFKLSEAKEGINYPVMHPRCRCTTTMNIDYTSRLARNPLTGRNYKVDGDMTYNEWIKSLTPEQKHALETTRLKESRKVQDKEQWLRYKKTLGTKEVGRSFSAFQDMKYGTPKKWTELKELYRQKSVDNSGKSDIMKSKDKETAVPELRNIGKIDITKYQQLTSKKIITDEVILTDNRRDHIIKRRGQKFYDEYSPYFTEIVSEPDYIFKDEHENSALACKTFSKSGNSVNLVVRLAVEGDDINYKNSIITAIKESDKRFAQRLRNNTPIYKKIDKNE